MTEVFFTKYLPIFQEIFESDNIVFILIGLTLAAFIGIKMHDTRQTLIRLISSSALYVESILLFVGTITIGVIIGSLIGTTAMKVRKQ